VTPRIGQRIPDFTLPDHNKQQRSLSEFLQRGTITLAFFPFAFSGVCDKEMCSFRDNLTRLSGVGGQVAGISVDSLYSLKVFAQTYGLQFPLLSDFNKKVTKLYGVLQDPWVGYGYRGVAKRSVFVADRKGLLRYRWITDVPSNEPPYDEVIAAVTKLAQ